jgi:hypothetical protein
MRQKMGMYEEGRAVAKMKGRRAKIVANEKTMLGDADGLAKNMVSCKSWFELQGRILLGGSVGRRFEEGDL